MRTPVTVKDLIVHLCKLPQDLPVAYGRHGGHRLLELHHLDVMTLGPADPTGYIPPRWNEETPTQDCLVLPGD